MQYVFEIQFQKPTKNNLKFKMYEGKAVKLNRKCINYLYILNLSCSKYNFIIIVVLKLKIYYKNELTHA